MSAPATPAPIAADALWACLAGVPDPELPVLSVVDLGVVRELCWRRGDDDAPVLHVVLTVTYSGCPGARAIAAEVEAALRARGVERLELSTRLTPVWSSGWISDAGRAKLAAAGIAPPQRSSGGGARASSVCPRCGSDDTEQVSAFGATPCKAQHRCRQCLEPYEQFKCV